MFVTGAVYILSLIFTLSDAARISFEYPDQFKTEQRCIEQAKEIASGMLEVTRDLHKIHWECHPRQHA